MPVLIVRMDADGDFTILIPILDLILLFLYIPQDSLIQHGCTPIAIATYGALRMVHTSPPAANTANPRELQCRLC